LLGQDAGEHPSDSFVSLHTPRRTRWGAPSPLLRSGYPIWRGRPTGTRHPGSPPRAETLSRGATGAERSELALRQRRSARGLWLSPRQQSPVTRRREEPLN
jgi:hypothetical protein